MTSSDFEQRTRRTLEEAQRVATAPGATIRHVLDNQDGTYSVMGHINCAFCDYCAEGGDPKDAIHTAKPNPYELSEEDD